MESPSFVSHAHLAADAPARGAPPGGGHAAAEPPGLVSSKTSPNFEVLINLDRTSVTERRVNRLKRSVWGSGHLHGMPRPGYRPDAPWFVTLTYADEDAWLPDHIADATERFRR